LVLALDLAGVTLTDGFQKIFAEIEQERSLPPGTVHAMYKKNFAEQLGLGNVTFDDFFGFLAEKYSYNKVDIKERTLAAFKPIEPTFKYMGGFVGTRILVTNLALDLWELLRDTFKLEDVFDKCLVSSILKARKPSSYIFLKLLEVGGEEPSNTFFVDDQIANVEAARQLGIQAYLFTPSVWRQIDANIGR